MATESVHSPRPVSEFFNDARPLVRGRRRICAMWLVLSRRSRIRGRRQGVIQSTAIPAQVR
jgi:hypothetical protein